jgi:ribosomal protein S18 acetylase RimI-like enzyme
VNGAGTGGRATMAAGVTIAAESAREMSSLLGVIPDVWIGASEERLRQILPRHAERDGFRFLAARADGRVVGLAYGYMGASGQWWHDIVSRAMTAEQRGWWLAPGHFEVVELHVHPDFRRLGIGTRLHDTLLDGLASPTAVLSTQADNEPALALYRGHGWEIVVTSLRFAPTGEPYAILGKRLRHG